MSNQTSMLNALSSWWNDMQTFTHEADNEAEKRFPGQARDSSVKNAYRHARLRMRPVPGLPTPSDSTHLAR